MRWRGSDSLAVVCMCDLSGEGVNKKYSQPRRSKHAIPHAHAVGGLKPPRVGNAAGNTETPNNADETAGAKSLERLTTARRGRFTAACRASHVHVIVVRTSTATFAGVVFNADKIRSFDKDSK
jgi:hypothetical protein